VHSFSICSMLGAAMAVKWPARSHTPSRQRTWKCTLSGDRSAKPG
jgi:hypothetical protein